MTREEFSKSGLLEQYLLGLTTPEEDQLVEQFLTTYPELQQELEQINEALNAYAGQQLSNIKSTATFSNNAQSSAVPSTLFWKLGLAATAVLSIWLYKVGNNYQADAQHWRAEYYALHHYCERSKELASQQEWLHHSKTRALVMRPIQAKEAAHFALAYLNPDMGKGWIDPAYLPKPQAGYQYQAWADVDHVMVNLGLLPTDSLSLVTIDYVDKTAGFNLTLEPIGGSNEPTLANLVYQGYWE